ncbi:hypothetical protein [Deinococcus sp.]|uniref:hypothetical protein n=1 Tax=Deinococcus sp. TaxID=47478 RepID=UPI0025FB1219|nr:hypothetical protein [Deinococcus sp.]
MHFVAGSCLICDDGLLGFRKSNGLIFLLCDECGSVFLDPSKVVREEAIFPSFKNGWLIPNTEASIAGEKSEWATKDDVDDMEWLPFLMLEIND